MTTKVNDDPQSGLVTPKTFEVRYLPGTGKDWGSAAGGTVGPRSSSSQSVQHGDSKQTA